MATLKQKSWLTLPEAARHLSEIVEEPNITEADLIHYAVEGDLTLSVYFPGMSPAFEMNALSDIEDAPLIIEWSDEAGPCTDLKTKEETHIVSKLYPLRRDQMSSSLIKAAKLDIEGKLLLNENIDALRELNTIVPNVTGNFFPTVDIDSSAYDDGDEKWLVIKEYKGYSLSRAISGLWDVPHHSDWASYLEGLMLDLMDSPDDIDWTINSENLTQYTWPPWRQKNRSLKIYARSEDRWVRPIFSELPRKARLVVSPSNLRKLTDEGEVGSTISNHECMTEELSLLNDAWVKFWKNASRLDRESWPINKDVEAWLIESGFSGVNAKAGATIIKPEWARKGGRR